MSFLSLTLELYKTLRWWTLQQPPDRSDQSQSFLVNKNTSDSFIHYSTTNILLRHSDGADFNERVCVSPVHPTECSIMVTDGIVGAEVN